MPSVATRIWTGEGATANWTDRFNWSGQEAPLAGDRLYFPPGAKQTSNTNDYTGIAFAAIDLGGGYIIGGNDLVLTSGSIHVFGTGTSTINANIATSAANFQVSTWSSSSQLLILAGNLTGSAGLFKSGAGQLELDGNNGYTGLTVVNGGTVVVGRPAALGTVGGPTSVNTGAQLQLAAGVGALAEPLVLRGSGPNGQGALVNVGGTNFCTGSVVLSGNASVGVASGTQLTMSGSIKGPYGLTKAGQGELVLSGANSYFGITTVANGLLTVQNALALGRAGIGAGTVVPANGTGCVRVAGGIMVFDELSLAGNGVRLENASGNNTWVGPITLATAAAYSTIGVYGGQLTLSGVIQGLGGLTKTGLGKLVLTTNNAYTGETRLLDGALQMQAPNALGAPNKPVQVGDGATLELAGGITVPLAKTLFVSGTGVDQAGALRSVSLGNRWDGPVVLQDEAFIGVDYGCSLTIGRLKQTSFAGPGSTYVASGGGLTKVGSGTLNVAGASDASYTGPTQILQGIVQIASNTALGSIQSVQGVTVANGAQLLLAAPGLDVGLPLILSQGAVLWAIASSRWSGPIMLAGQASVGSAPDERLTLSGYITGITGAGLDISSSGTVEMTSTNDYDGQTTIKSGTLELNGFDLSSPIVVGPASPGKAVPELSGMGFIDTDITVLDGGRLSPGTAKAASMYTSLTAYGSVTLTSGATLQESIGVAPLGTASSSLRAYGTLTLAGSLTVKLAGNPPTGSKYTAVMKVSPGLASGTFDGLPEGGTFTDPVSGVSFQITYQGGTDSNDVILTRVPTA